MIKKLVFEGAGSAESAGAGIIGNDRIRTCFHNDDGKPIFLEIIGHYVTKFTSKNLQKYKPVCGVVDNCYYIPEPGKDYGSYYQLIKMKYDERRYFAYNRGNIIELLKELNTTVESIEIDNTGYYHAFKTDGYNYGDEY